MKNVLMIAYTLNRAGMERQLVNYLYKYDRSKLKVTIALFKKEIGYVLPPDVGIIDLKKDKRFSVTFFIRLIKELRSKKYEVVNCKLSTLSMYIMLIKGLFFESNLIIEVRSEKDVTSFIKKVNFFHFIFRQKWMLIFNSNKALSIASEKIRTGIELKYIPNGVDTEKFCRKDTKENDGFFVLGYAGRITPLKNLELLIKAFAKFLHYHPATKLCITGKIDAPEYFEALVTLIQELKINNHIFIEENRPDIEKFYNQIDLFILPSFFEGTPNVLLEAMSSECICLISEDANTDHFLSDHFVFNSRNELELYEKIKLAYHFTDQQKQQIGRENRGYIIKNYNIGQMVKELDTCLISKSS